MSIIKAASFQHPSSATTNIDLSADGSMQINGTTGSLGLSVTSGAGIFVTKYSSTAGGTLRLARSASDTLGVGDFPTSNTALGALTYQGWSNGAFNTGVNLTALTAETWTNTARGSYLQLSTVPIGGTTPTERMRIGSDGLITGSGPSLGAWISYTPTIGGTGWAVGNGTLTSHYCQIGKTVFFRIYFVTGSTTTYGTTALTWTLPVTAKATTYLAQIFRGMLNSSTSYALTAYPNSTTTMRILIPSTTGTLLPLIQTTPYTMTTGDGIYVSGSYEAA